jgi:hypothetical protein
MKRLGSWLLRLTLVWGLVGCASTRLIDSQVNSFAPAPLVPGAGFAFERLPSQQTAQQDLLERLALTTLNRVGLHLDTTSPRYLLQLGSSLRLQTTYPNTGLSGSMGWGLGTGRAGSSHKHLMLWMDSRTLYLREFSLVMRDAATGAVVYETHASNDNPWPDDEAIWGALIDAALQGFPKPPTGPRQVPIDIPW